MRTAWLCLVLAALASAPGAWAQGTYTQIDVPGAAGTLASGIDTAGDVVGSYANATNYQGFLLSNGVYTTINYPGSVNTYLLGLNDRGQIVGYATEPNVGFLYTVSSQTFTVIAYPEVLNTYPSGINNSGTIVGTVEFQSGALVGFEFSGSQYKSIKPPHALGSFVNGITEAGELSGYVHSLQGGDMNFLYKQGKYESIPAVGYGPVLGISSNGVELVGLYQPISGLIAGFVYGNKTFTELLPSGSMQSMAYGANSAGIVVGYFVDSSFNTHGFTWTPSAEAKRK